MDRHDFKQGAVATLTFDGEAAKSLSERWLMQMTGWIARAIFEDGTCKDVRIVCTDDETYGALWVQDWREADDSLIGEPYCVDLYGGGLGPAIPVRSLHIY